MILSERLLSCWDSAIAEDLHQQNVGLFKHFTNFNDLANPYALSRSRIGPLPVVIENQQLCSMQAIADALNEVVPSFIHAWHYSPDHPEKALGVLGKKLRSIISLPTRIENLLLGTPIMTGVGFGTMRPDLVIHKDKYLVCEINARFSVNGYFLSAHLNEVTRLQSCVSHTMTAKLHATSIPHMHSLIPDFRKKFPGNKVWFICEKEKMQYDILLFQNTFPDLELHLVGPNQLQVIDAHLCDGSGTLIQSCILELHQDELLGLPDDILTALLVLSDQGACLNHLRAIFLAHDKRLLSILSGYFGKPLLEHFSTNPAILQTLLDHVMPTTLVSQALNSDLNISRFAWSFIGGGTNNSTLFKPALAGKGQDLVISHQFPDFNEFMKHIQSWKSPTYAEGILQPYMKTSELLIPTYDDQAKTWILKSLPTVGTLLLMDGVFYGPGIFRSQDSEVIALSRGGWCCPAALSLPDVPPSSRFLVSASNLDNPIENADLIKLKQDMRTAFYETGVVFATIDDRGCPRDTQWWNPSCRLQTFVEQIFGGVPVPHLDDGDVVWDIKQTIQTGVVARSNTLNYFEPHTDASWETNPPRIIALAIVHSDRKNGGTNALVKVEDILKKKFIQQEILELERYSSVISIPPEFRKKDEPQTQRTLPLFVGQNRIRFRHDIVHTKKPVLNKLNTCAQRMAEDPANQRLLPERCVILFDNQKFIHSRTQIHDPRRLLKRVRFHLPDWRSPRLDDVLLKQARDIGIQNTKMELSEFPIVSSTPTPDPSLLTMYWSPSGQSGTSVLSDGTTNYFHKVVGTHSNQNDLQRKLFSQGVLASGALHEKIKCANLFSFGNLYRSGEIIGELLRECNASNYALGSLAPDEAIQQILVHPQFQVNCVAGFSTKLIFLATNAQQGKFDLSKIELILFAGEPLPESQRQLLHSVCHPNLQFLGLYGSAECGVFSFQSTRTIQRAKALGRETVNAYEYVDDIAHVEIVPDEDNDGPNQEIGRLVITNLIREPRLVRYDTGDLAELNSRSDNLFWLHGRQKSSRGVAVGKGWIYYDDILSTVLQPFGLHEKLCQVWLDDAEEFMVVTLVVLEDQPQIQEQVEPKFGEYVKTSCGEAGVKAKLLLSTEEKLFIRSSRSQKLVKFVDRRAQSVKK